MFERFARESRHAVVRALEAARRLGAEQVEPEHLLLALAEGCADPAARALMEAGLDAEAIAAAMEADLAAVLAAVGVPPTVVASTPARPRSDRPALAPLTKRALEQALREAVHRHDRRMGTEHVLLGLLRPPVGAVPRLLDRLDVEPERLAALVQVEAAARG